MRDQYSISELCSALGVSRSGYHAARQRPPSARAEHDRRLLDAVKDIHAHRHTRCYGSPRMTDELRSRGLACSPNRVARIMRQAGIRVRPRRAFRPRTTRQDPAAKPAQNLLKDSPAPTAPGQQLVSDITYIPTREGWLYLVIVIDLYSRAILGWKTAASLHTDMVLAAIAQAMTSGWILPGAIFHSDRGCQYSAAATRQMLQHFELRQSMSAKGYCYDNAFAESAFATLKAELPGDGRPFQSHAQANLTLFDYLETFYNRRRRHSSLDGQSPLACLNQHFENHPASLN